MRLVTDFVSGISDGFCGLILVTDLRSNPSLP